MGKLTVFNSISLDGFFVDMNGDMNWAHNTNKDEEWDVFVASNASGGGVLLFGRKTYDLMVSYWPTPLALQNDPVVAEGMNDFQKIVFSRTLDKISWKNSRLVKNGLVEEIRKMKNEPGTDTVILGSGSIIAQLTQERLIDEYQVVMIPVVLDNGRTMFEGLKKKLVLKLTSTRIFKNGNVFLTYVPAA
jgi:dihydrofolate reductase